MVATSKNLLLRELVEGDWADLHAYTGDEQISRYQAWAPHSEQDAKNWVQLAISDQQKSPRQNYYWGICLKDSGKLIGGMGVHLLPTENARSAEIGYALHRSYWQMGYGFEAVREGLRSVFVQTDIRRVVAHCRDINPASIALLEKLKFRREGHFIEDVEVRGKLMSSYWYAMLRSEFLDAHS